MFEHRVFVQVRLSDGFLGLFLGLKRGDDGHEVAPFGVDLVRQFSDWGESEVDRLEVSAADFSLPVQSGGIASLGVGP